MANILYKVQVGAFGSKTNAQKRVEALKDKGFNAVLIYENKLYKVQCGAFANKDNATTLKTKLEKAGFKVAIIQVKQTSESTAVSGAQKVYELMKPYIDSKTAHSDFIKKYNAFIDVYNKAHGTSHSKIGTSNAWCTMFVDLMFYEAGMLDLIGYGKRALNLMNNAKKLGTWKSGSNDIQFGDVVIYQDSNGDPNHTEFAIGSHTFISGNYNGGVHKRYRSSLGSVKGRIRPKYKD